MNLAVYVEQARIGLVEPHLRRLRCSGDIHRYVFYHNYDDFISGIIQDDCHITVVCCEGASGMEGARAAKQLMPSRPLIWLSEDRGFGPESYRIGCTYFAAAPLSESLLKKALQHSLTKIQDT